MYCYVAKGFVQMFINSGYVLLFFAGTAFFYTTFEVLTVKIYGLYKTIMQVELCSYKTWSYVRDANISCRCLKHNAKENV